VDQATALMLDDVAWAETAVRNAIKVDISQAMFDALVSFAYNVGAGAFARSTLVKRINDQDPGASSEFGRWIFASGVQNGALIARRQSEQNQFESQTA
jgi:lysozyme